ncbi:MAG TPA: putative Ig domain-containing protein [Gemmataceae bacterium]|nr:putative Ig domain-containing protein [Gemmataceae bacterium]
MSSARRSLLTLRPLEDRTAPAAGSLDLSFDGDGRRLLFSGGPQYDGARGLALDPAGRIYVAGDRRVNGEFQLIVSRFTPDGGFDPTFGPTHEGFVPLAGPGMPPSSHGYALTLDAEGRILVAGTASVPGTAPQFVVARFTPDGLLDPTFDGDGVAYAGFGTLVTGYALAVGVDSAGRVVVAGEVDDSGDYDIALARFTTTGALDPNFGTGGLVRTAAPGFGAVGDLAIDPLGRIAVVGTIQDGADGLFEFAVGRYTAAGDLDPSFNGGDFVRPFAGTAGGGSALVLDRFGRLVVTGGIATATDTGDFTLVRLNADGTPDFTFGTAGKVVTSVGPYADVPTSLVQDPEGRTVVAGWTDSFGKRRFAVARYTPTGALDPVFSDDGIVTTDFDTLTAEAYQVARDRAGRLLVAGAAWDPLGSDHPLPHFFAAARYIGDTAPKVIVTPGDTAFNGSAVAVDPGLDVSDDGNANLIGGTVTIEGYVPGEDVITFTTRPGITASFDAQAGVLTLTGTAWHTEYRSVLRSVTYANSSTTPNPQPRTFVFALDDGSPNAADGAGRKTVQIVSANQPPVIAGVPATASIVPGATLSFTATATDPNVPAQGLSFSLVGAPDGASINPATGVFTWAVDPDTVAGDYTFDVRVTDAGSPALSDSESITVTVNRVVILDVVPNQGGTLAIAGTDGDDDIRVALLDPTRLTVTVNGEAFGPFGTFNVVRRIVARGFDGDDRIQIAADVPAFARLEGGDGADTLTAGGYSSTLVGGAGADRLVGGADGDSLIGGPGDDRMAGGPGEDRYGFDRDWGLDRVTETGTGGYDFLDFTAADLPGVTTTVGTRVTVTAGGSRVTTNGRTVESVLGTAGPADVVHFPAGNNTWHVGGRVNDWFLPQGFEILQGGSGSDRFLMGSGFGLPVRVDGGGGSDTVDYSFTRDALAVDLAAGTATGLTGFARVETFKGQDGNKPTQRTGLDYFTGPNAAATWTLRGDGSVNVNGTRFIGFDVVTAGPFADTFRFVGRTWGRARLDGGGGTNALDYSDVVGRVIVNLGAHGATGGFDVRNFADVTGGAGADRLNGGADDDILIGGTTAHDLSAVAQSHILTEWWRPAPYPAAPYANRVRHLLGTLGNGLNETTFLNETTVFADGAADVLTGGTGSDWFLTGPGDGISDRADHERRTRV